MKLLSLFSGIGAFEKALDRLNVPYELVGFSEIDRYAVKSYCAIHGVDEAKNFGDITKIDEKALPKDIDLVTYGFPCQDISLAGKQKGLFNEDGTQTRSGLFFEALRIIEATKPRVAIAENVKNLTSKKFSEQFKIVLDSLEDAGYNNYWQVLNAKDYGIPQNRERVFIVSIRKDIDTGCFKFPQGFPLELRLKDLLEEIVDSKHFLEVPFNEYPDHTCRTIKNQYFKNSHANFLLTTARGATGVLVCVKEATKQGYAEAYEGDSINLEQPNSKTRRGRVGHGVAQTLTTSPQQAVVLNPLKDRTQYGWHFEQNVYDKNGIVRAVKAGGGSGNIPKVIEDNSMTADRAADIMRNEQCCQDDSVFIQAYEKAINALESEDAQKKTLRIRKLTPKECFRLMDFDDSDYEKAEAVNSNTQLYKQAGNSIVVAVAKAIIEMLINAAILHGKGE